MTDEVDGGINAVGDVTFKFAVEATVAAATAATVDCDIKAAAAAAKPLGFVDEDDAAATAAEAMHCNI